MELPEFQALLERVKTGCREPETVYQALFEADPSATVVLHIENVLQHPESSTRDLSVVLLGRLIRVLSSTFLALGDESYHTAVRASLMQCLHNSDYSHYCRSYISIVIATLADLYCRAATWPDLGPSLLELAASGDSSIAAVAIDCLSECINNQSLTVESLDGVVPLLEANLVETCEPAILISSLRLLYSTQFRGNASERVIQLLPLLHGREFETGLSDLVHYYSEVGEFIGAEIISVYLEVLMDLSQSEDISIGSHVCLLDFIADLICQHAECVHPGIPSFVEFFFRQLTVPHVEVADEAADGIDRIAQIFGGTEPFNAACYELFAHFSAVDQPTELRVAAYVLMTQISSGAICYIEAASEIWAIAEPGFSDEDPEIRTAAFRFAGRFFRNLADPRGAVMPEVSIAWIVHAIENEPTSEVLNEVFPTLDAFCIFLGESLREFAEGLLDLLLPMLQLADNPRRAMIVDVAKQVSMQMNIAVPELRQFCDDVVHARSPEFSRMLFFRCLNALATLPDATAEGDQELFTTVLQWTLEDLSSSEVSILNGILRDFLENKHEMIGENWAHVCELIVSKIGTPIRSLAVPLTSCQIDVMNSVTVINRKENAIICYDRHQLFETREYLRTLYSLLVSPFGEQLADISPEICESLLMSLDCAFGFDFVCLVINCFKAIVPIAPTELSSLLFLKGCEILLQFDEIVELTDAVNGICEAFHVLSMKEPSQELCDIAATTYVALVRKAAELQAISEKRGVELLDFRETSGPGHALDLAVFHIILLVFEHYRGAASVAWREAVPLGTTSVLALYVWGSFFIHVTQDDAILEYIISCLTFSDGSVGTFRVRREAACQIALIARNRIPLAGPAVNLIVAALLDVRAGHPWGKFVRVIGETLLYFFYVYHAQCDAEVIIGTLHKCCPLEFDGTRDIKFIGESMLFVLTAFWPIMREWDIKRLGWWLHVSVSSSALCALDVQSGLQGLFEDEVFQTLVRNGNLRLLHEVTLKLPGLDGSIDVP
jgi:hypothetical protein